MTTPTAGIAIVDRGNPSPGSSPDDFHGKVHHAVTQDVVASAHALQVLKVALERLKGSNTIHETSVACALVTPPSKAIGLRCFEHANVTEMLAALQSLGSWLSSSIPWAINVSLGAHVGPHNGESPLEEYIARIASPSHGRFLVAAAGNDGMTGVAGRRELKAGVRDFLKIRTGPNGATELFLEFWWQEPTSASGFSMAIEAWPYDQKGTPLQSGPVRIDAQRSGSILHSTTGFQGHTLSTLFHSAVRNGMSCAALGISNTSGLPVFDLEIGFEASHDVVVNGWIVVCTDPLTAFVEAGNEGTVIVPATAAGVLCVAGIDANGQPWSRSSRGPAPPPMPWARRSRVAFRTLPTRSMAGFRATSARASLPLAPPPTPRMPFATQSAARDVRMLSRSRTRFCLRHPGSTRGIHAPGMALTV